MMVFCAWGYGVKYALIISLSLSQKFPYYSRYDHSKRAISPPAHLLPFPFFGKNYIIFYIYIYGGRVKAKGSISLPMSEKTNSGFFGLSLPPMQQKRIYCFRQRRRHPTKKKKKKVRIIIIEVN